VAHAIQFAQELFVQGDAETSDGFHSVTNR
jgi:hypothetical protein